MDHLDGDIEREIVALLPRLRRFALALCRSSSDADDLVQATCERAIANLDKWHVGTRLDSWMYRIARNLHYNGVRDTNLRRGKLQLVANSEARSLDGEKAAMASIELKRVMLAIDQLPEEQRAVLLLVVVEGHGYKETAEILEIPIGTVTSRLARAREALREQIGGDEA